MNFLPFIDSLSTPLQTRTDVLIVGGGLGGVAAALAVTEAGYTAILTESTDWLGGQMTSQMVPPDEHPWIEQFGRTRRYAELRSRVREHYRRNFPLNHEARSNPNLNPGNGTVSKLCHLPAVSAAVMEEMLAPAIARGRLQIFFHCSPRGVDHQNGEIRTVHFFNRQTSKNFSLSAPYVLDATELGDLLPLANMEYVTGAESRQDTGELHAVDGPAQPDNVQAITWCFPMAYDRSCNSPREEYQIPQPRDYAFWKNHEPQLSPPWSGKLLSLLYSNPKTRQPTEFPIFPDPSNPAKWNLWNYRKILTHTVFDNPDSWHEVTLVNWPQNDYMLGNLIDASEEQQQTYLEQSRQLSLSFAWWLQNEAPRPDGGQGYPGLYLRPDLTGTVDGLAKAPYIRESRRIRGLCTVTENDIGTEARGNQWPDPVPDSVGVGSYRMDLHPSTNGMNYIDIGCYSFQIPLGTLIPRTESNLIAAGKNISTTHITNGCYRLHPVEWNIGEAAGALAAYCLKHAKHPSQVRQNPTLLADYQNSLIKQGVELQWPAICPR